MCCRLRLDTTELTGLPTLDELGLPGFEVSVWQGLYAPRGTPQGVLDVLAAALRLAVQDAEFVRRQVALGAVVNSDSRLSGLGHKRFVQAQALKWAELIKAAGSSAD